jgi:hypothetical protein
LSKANRETEEKERDEEEEKDEEKERDRGERESRGEKERDEAYLQPSHARGPAAPLLLAVSLSPPLP